MQADQLELSALRAANAKLEEKVRRLTEGQADSEQLQQQEEDKDIMHRDMMRLIASTCRIEAALDVDGEHFADMH